MDRSRGFGSHKDKLFLLSLRFPPSTRNFFPLGFQLACPYHLQAHYTKGTAVSSLLRFTWFPVLFHSSFAILFNFPSRYSLLYRCMLVFSLRCFVHLILPLLTKREDIFKPRSDALLFLLVLSPIRDSFTLFGFVPLSYFLRLWLFWVQVSILLPPAYQEVGFTYFAHRYFRYLSWFLFLQLLRWFSSLSFLHGVFTLWDSLTSNSLCQVFRLFFRPYHIP